MVTESSSGEFYGLPMEVESEDGEVYTLKAFEATLEKIEDLWDKVGEFSVLFSDYTQGDRDTFVQWLLDPRTVILEVDDVGIIYATDLLPRISALGHYLFWDKQQAGRQKVVMAALDWTMDQFDLHRVTMKIPRFAYSALHRVYKMGFKLEGVLRESVLHNGYWADQFVFGVTIDELNDEALEQGELRRSPEEGKWFGLLEEDDILMRKVVRNEWHDEASKPDDGAGTTDESTDGADGDVAAASPPEPVGGYDSSA